MKPATSIGSTVIQQLTERPKEEEARLEREEVEEDRRIIPHKPLNRTEHVLSPSPMSNLPKTSSMVAVCGDRVPKEKKTLETTDGDDGGPRAEE